MPPTISKVAFSQDLLPAVANFSCGGEPWDTEVSDWIKGPLGAYGALECMGSTKKPCRVWLYLNSDGAIVGYGSLGLSNWDKTPRLNVIPNVAVHSDHQGKGYFTAIMQDLIEAAKEECCDTNRGPILGLFVHPQNTKAIAIYRHFGFEDWPQTFTDKSTKVVYQGMAKRIDPLR